MDMAVRYPYVETSAVAVGGRGGGARGRDGGGPRDAAAAVPGGGLVVVCRHAGAGDPPGAAQLAGDGRPVHVPCRSSASSSWLYGCGPPPGRLAGADPCVGAGGRRGDPSSAPWPFFRFDSGPTARRCSGTRSMLPGTTGCPTTAWPDPAREGEAAEAIKEYGLAVDITRERGGGTTAWASCWPSKAT